MKLRAIENLHNAGVEIVPVTTIVNGINNEQVGRIIQFALDNPKKSASSRSSRYRSLAVTKRSLTIAARRSATP